MEYINLSTSPPLVAHGSYRRRARGATTIEVLVSMLVLAVGLLGFAGMQMVGIKSNHSAQIRSQATLLAYDLADRMRGARDAALDGDYDDDTGDTDRKAWDKEVARRLGADATARVTRNEANITIEIIWFDQRGDIRTVPEADEPDPPTGGETPPADSGPGVTAAQADVAPEASEPGEAQDEDGNEPAQGHVVFAYSTEI